MPQTPYSKGTIKIGAMTCDLCPTQWDCTLPDGRQGFIHYRSGELNLYADNGHSIENNDDFDDYALTLEQVTSWLESLFYDVEND
jgi:hypothetical protein